MSPEKPPISLLVIINNVKLWYLNPHWKLFQCHFGHMQALPPHELDEKKCFEVFSIIKLKKNNESAKACELGFHRMIEMIRRKFRNSSDSPLWSLEHSPQIFLLMILNIQLPKQLPTNLIIYLGSYTYLKQVPWKSISSLPPFLFPIIHKRWMYGKTRRAAGEMTMLYEA